MNKSELIDAIADSADLTKADAGRALDGVIGAITDALKNGERRSRLRDPIRTTAKAPITTGTSGKQLLHYILRRTSRMMNTRTGMKRACIFILRILIRRTFEFITTLTA